MKIEKLNLSVRTYHRLKRAGIDTVERLREMSNEELLSVPGFGIACLKDVCLKVGRPAVPGPAETDPNITELCFRNGERNMKEKIIAMLMEHKTHVKGVCHAHVVEIIRMVEIL